MTRHIVAMVLALGLCACSGSGDVVVDADTTDSRGQDAVVELQAADTSPDAGEPDLETGLDLASDTEPEILVPACDPGEGCFLDPCEENADCQSGWCVEHMGDALCSQVCAEECPAGWSCKQVGVGPDLMSVCISNMANLCKPCHTTEGCKAPGGAEDVCVDYGAEGSFCGGMCQGDGDCPWGFSCVEAQTVDGVATTQCVADAGGCPCTGRSVALALSTPCEVGNEIGLCIGTRVCTEEGLSSCSAAVPVEELCNGLDDDCDGQLDEETCDDGNDCTADTCFGEAGCDHAALDAGECLDGNPCTVADHCVAGVCQGTLVTCDDENPCTDDSCDETGGCVFVHNAAECDDGDPCTLGDHCVTGACLGEAVSCQCDTDADCAVLEDGDLCNGTLICAKDVLPFTCVVDPDTVVDCPAPQGPDAFCLASACDPATGACSLVPAHEDFPCDDGDPCTMGEACAEGACEDGAPVNCNDGNPCTDDLCDPQQGCLHTDNAAPCNDADACTINDFCDGGTCVGAVAVVCDDGNPCTDDLCDPAQGCQHTQNQAPCDDGNACTTGDHCAGGQCTFAGSKSCSDENICTTDSCDPATGCVHQLNSSPCDDDDVCTTGDHCHLGSCIAAGALLCSDGNPCTDDECEPATGCVFEPNSQACDDGNQCTGQDQCAAGACQGGGVVDCDDGDPCTDDGCAPDSGCVYVNNAAPCDDGDICTTGDLCAAGACQGGAPLPCDDGNPCTDDSCLAGIGCQFIPNTLPCDDDDACTEDDVCGGGSCGGTPIQCSDTDVCTTDTCEPDIGCVFVPITPCCGNGVTEAGESCDDGNTVSGDGCDGACQSENDSGCADGSADQIFLVGTMVGCNGAWLGTQIADACGPGWHPANPNEYFTYGGKTVSPSQMRWVDTAWSSSGNDVPLAQWSGYYDCSNSSGWQGVCTTNDCTWVSSTEQCYLTFATHDYGYSYGCHCRGGNPNSSTHGVVCVNDAHSMPRL